MQDYLWNRNMWTCELRANHTCKTCENFLNFKNVEKDVWKISTCDHTKSYTRVKSRRIFVRNSEAKLFLATLKVASDISSNMLSVAEVTGVLM